MSIKVVMVAACPFPANHGTPGAIRELALYLVKQGCEVHVVSYPEHEDIPVDGLHIHRVSAPFIKPGKIKIGPSWERIVYDMVLVPKLVSVIRKHGIDVIHAHNYEATIAGAMAKVVTGKPLIYTGVNSMYDELPTYPSLRPKWLARGFGRFLDHLVPRTGDVLMVLSDELKDYLMSLGIPERKILVIPPGVELEMFAAGEADKARARLGLADSDKVVMYTGALEEFQRVDYLFQAMKGVVERNPAARLVLVGNVNNPEAKQRFLALGEELGIGDRIHYADSVPLSELSDYLALADVAVVPRPSCPGYPIKLLNYMAAGKAIVSFKGSAKALCHGFNGYVAEDHDVEDMARGIELLLADDELRKSLGERARETIPGVYDWDTLAKGTLAMYEQLDAKPYRLDRAALGEHLKASYVPECSDLPVAAAEPEDRAFLREGVLSFPCFKNGSA